MRFKCIFRLWLAGKLGRHDKHQYSTVVNHNNNCSIRKKSISGFNLKSCKPIAGAGAGRGGRCYG